MNAGELGRKGTSAEHEEGAGAGLITPLHLGFLIFKVGIDSCEVSGSLIRGHCPVWLEVGGHWLLMEICVAGASVTTPFRR